MPVSMEAREDAESLMRVSKRRLAEAKRLHRDAAGVKDKNERHKQKKRALALVDEANEIAREAQDILVRK